MLVLLGMGCSGGDACDEGWFADADGDGFGGGVEQRGCPPDEGFARQGGDCDDADPLVNPDGRERCGTAWDDDCDGDVNDAPEAPTWYVDADHDGYGAVPVVACERPEGMVDNDLDCDDTRPEVNPDAEETCKTSWDDDCDGSTEGAADPLPWYLDADGDGVGSHEVFACSAPQGAVAIGGDCDDADPSLTRQRRVSWRTEEGVEDLTSTFAAGAPGEPVQQVLAEDGTLKICEGTWYLQLGLVGAHVELLGAGEGEVVLSGGTSFGELVVVGVDSSLIVEDLRFDRARTGPAVISSGDLSLARVAFTSNRSGGDAPGALQVLDGSLLGEELEFVGNSGGQGGAVAITGGTATLDGVLFEDNLADRGGGLYVEVDSVLSSAVFMDNQAERGGALATSAALRLDDPKVHGNVAEGQGGGAYVFGQGSVECRSSGGTFGFWANTAQSGGAAYLAADSLESVHQVRVDSKGCDWTHDEDNSPTDLDMRYGPEAWYFGDNANFGCNGGGCQ